MIDRGKTIHIRVPASTANLGPGFDSLGLALPFYLTIRVQLAEKDTIRVHGEHLASLPLDSSNLIYQTIRYFFEKEDQVLPPIALEIESEIPLSRGLGSSGSAIIAGLLAANELLDGRRGKEEILQYAAELEGHADNVAASLYGGFVVTSWDGQKARAESFAIEDQLQVLLAIPNYTLSTNKARSAIPEAVPVKDAAYNIGHSALLVTYFVTGQFHKIPLVMKDRLHQSYRQAAVKGLERVVKDMNEQGNWGAALSGAGPTLILFLQPNQVDEAKLYLNQVALDEKIEFQLENCTIENNGAKVEVLRSHLSA